MIHLISPNTLYILSGPSGSGKSFFTKNLLEKKQIKPDCIINPDTVRLNIMGITPKIDENGYYEHLNGWLIGNKETFSIAMAALELRMKMSMLTFFDATCLTDKDRKDLVAVAKKYDMDAKIIIFDVEKDWCINNLKNRLHRFEAQVVDKQFERFDKKSVYNYISFNPKTDSVVLSPNLIETEKIDIIGDTHGLKEDTISLLSKMGWSIHNNYNLKHSDSNRKILFLGDIIDRGQEGEYLLDIVENAVNSKRAYFLLGNHEKKLIKMLDDYYAGKVVDKRSISVTLFFKKFIALPEKKQKKFYKFLKSSPTNYSIWIDKNTGLALTKSDLVKPDFNESNVQKFGFAHADVSYYDDYVNVPNDLIFGTSTGSISNDYQYEQLQNLCEDKMIYIHGHQPLKNKEKEVDEKNTKYQWVYSLDNRCAYAGNILGMNFEKLSYVLRQHNFEPTQEIYKQCTQSVDVSFNFNTYLSSINVDQAIDLSSINQSRIEDNKDKHKYPINNKNKL